MSKLPFSTWIRNAAAALSGQHGAVSQQAAEAGCSRQTVYVHGQQLPERLAESDRRIDNLQMEIGRLKEEREQLQKRLQQSVEIGPEALQRFAVVGQAIGISLRQTEELLGTLLPAEQVPDHATLGRWTAAAGQRAGAVLAVLDRMCAPAVRTLCVDEIFFGG
jgi:FtsZ-binding cell division protein ZapB